MFEKDYAYVDRFGVVHVVDAKETAERFARGTVVEVDAEVIPSSGGYPKVDGKHVFAYVDEQKIFIGGNGNNNKGELVALGELPTALQGVLKELGYSE